jgi:hypothetical protein
MIIWLASYPKSGNTLVRTMLSAYLFSEDGIFNFELLRSIKQFPNKIVLDQMGIKLEDFNEIIKNSIKGQELYINRNSVGFCKTHNMLYNYKKKYPFTNSENTLGVIYIVRDPRNVVLSYARHVTKPIEETVKFVTSGKCIKHDIMGNWSENYQSWKALKTENKYLLIKYEDLVSKREETFLKILNFVFKLRKINFVLNKKKFKNTIKTTTFDNLKKLESESNFYESAKNNEGEKINFFDKGQKRNWLTTLDKNLSDQIEKTFNKEMIELGYL